jgi:hypothetical protein
MRQKVVVLLELTCEDRLAAAVIDQTVRAGDLYGLSPTEIAEDLRLHRRLQVSSVCVDKLADGRYRVNGCIVSKP